MNGFKWEDKKISNLGLCLRAEREHMSLGINQINARDIRMQPMGLRKYHIPSTSRVLLYLPASSVHQIFMGDLKQATKGSF